ncbi:uncharacterized protein [Palaemon carinicauda]|uniref:uncharacterized protein n=1 Tax=Palaemon carinicauda TaxID=392227 RepID=UPI0035B5963D
MDRMYRKDSTISSKISEYDNVPILPRNYYDHQYRDQDDLLVPTTNAHITPTKTHHHQEIPRPAPRYHSFPVDTAPPVPPHQVPLVNSHDQTTSSSPLHHTNGSSVESHTPPSEVNQKPSAFPLEQEDYDSLDARLVMQHRKMLKQKKEQEELQQKLQKQQKHNQHTQTPLSPQQEHPPEGKTQQGQISKSPSSDQKGKQESRNFKKTSPRPWGPPPAIGALPPPLGKPTSSRIPSPQPPHSPRAQLVARWNVRRRGGRSARSHSWKNSWVIIDVPLSSSFQEFSSFALSSSCVCYLRLEWGGEESKRSPRGVLEEEKESYILPDTCLFSLRPPSVMDKFRCRITK